MLKWLFEVVDTRSNTRVLIETTVSSSKLCCVELWHLVIVELITMCHNSTYKSLSSMTTVALFNLVHFIYQVSFRVLLADDYTTCV